MSLFKSSFQSYELSEQNSLQGSVLSPLQAQVIQNEISTIAEQILSLTYNPLNPMEFVQQDSFLKGQIQCLQYILAKSESSQAELIRLAQSSQGN